MQTVVFRAITKFDLGDQSFITRTEMNISLKKFIEVEPTHIEYLDC